MLAANEESQRTATQPIFKDLDADELESDVNIIESLCLNCGENGTTRLLLTKIPFYKEIIVMSFSCPHCGASNNETQFGGKIQEMGNKITVHVQHEKDLSRQVVRSDFATISIPELEFEIPPPLARKGEITNIEGLIDRTVTDLKFILPQRKQLDPSVAIKLEGFIEKLQQLKNVKKPFHFVINDPSGNSYIENLYAPQKDIAMEIINYKRSNKDNEFIGLTTPEEVEDSKDEVADSEQLTDENVTEQIMTFRTNCSNCNSPCETNMKLTKIPYFKEVIIMATTCDICGCRTNEVKSGAGIEPQGIRIELHMTDETDLTRDILKSENCNVIIPELEFEMGAGTLGGRFTTVEGLLQGIKAQLLDDNPLIGGDTLKDDIFTKIKEFGKKLDDIKSCKLPIHLILDDPSGNSYIQNLYAPEDDPEMKITKYDRTFEQDDDLGLNDMKTDNY